MITNINESKRRRMPLVLDEMTVTAINEEIARHIDYDSANQSLEAVHGSFTVEVVKGRFTLVKASGSGRIIQPAKQKTA